ncbi:MAG: HupE/UreJ family protein [Flavobacteriaceae bacterium]
MKKILFRFILIILFLVPLSSFSHIPNQSYIFLRIYEKEGIEGRFELNIREINKVFGLDLKKGIKFNELDPYIEGIQAYLLKNAAFSSKLGRHKIVFREVGIFPGNLGDFIQFYFILENTKVLPEDLDVEYSAVFEKDATHRGFLITEYNWRAGVINQETNISLDFGPNDTKSTLNLTNVSLWKGFVAMIKQGIWHIWIGLDHILFLLALILPSVVRRKRSANMSVTQTADPGYSIWSWEPAMKFKSAFLYIVKVITFFTIAHTITLSLASLKIIILPSQLVESVIALSIGLAAFHNIRPIFKGRDWIIAFGFGLFHGFGFASVLGDLGLTREFLTLSLLGFNVGVEIGQLVIILIIFPFLFLLRKRTFYPKLLVYGSVLLIIVSLYWFIERALDVNFGIEDYLRSVAYEIAVYLGFR